MILMKKNNNKFNAFLIIFRIISFIIIIISLYSIFDWYMENKNSKNILENTLSNVEINTTQVELPNETITDYQLLDVDFNSLVSTNKDVIAWIYLSNTNINYPIVKSDDNSFYINHSFDGSYNSAGWIFADSRCNSDFTSYNTTIYAHNRKDGSMFGSLKNILDSNWCDSNKYITIATPDGNMIYEIFSVYKIQAEAYYTTPHFNSETEYSTFLKTITNRSFYNFNVEVTPQDKIITLSTCYRINSHRVVLHAKLVKTI